MRHRNLHLYIYEQSLLHFLWRNPSSIDLFALFNFLCLCFFIFNREATV